MTQKGSGFAVFAEVGCGKTLTAIAIAGVLYQKKLIEHLLVVCPASVTVSWQNDFAKFAGFNAVVEPMQGDKKKRLDELNKLQAKENCLQVAVINYESTFREGIFEALQKFNADMIICDESQRIKTHNALQSKAMHKLGDNAKYKLILSGTPVQNNALDVYSQYRFLDPSIFGKSFYNFKARYAIMGGFGGHQIIGFKDLDDLIKKAHSIAFRVTKEECLDLPEQIFINREIDFEDKARKAYDALKRDCVAQIGNDSTVTANTVLTQILRLQQFTGGFVNDDEGNSKQVSTAKLDALKDILQDYLTTGKKAVIFARFTAELKAIKKLLEKDLKVQYVFIDGSVPLSHRGSIVNTFQTDDDCKVFLAQSSTAGLGITLTAASLTVFYSFSYNYTEFIQCVGRTHRIGQKEKCTYINLIIKNTIDAKILKALEHKDNTAKYIVDNWRNYF